VERILKIISGWKEKILSMGGKEALQAVAQAIPVYAMSVFKLSKNICKGITDAIAHLWWGANVNNKKMHWCAWWKLCVSKMRGDMGFRDPHCFHLAMLAKQVWHILYEPEFLCAAVL
jgi:hypothetical protein